MQKGAHLLVKSKSCAAVVESEVVFQGELSISLLFQDNFHNAYVRITATGELHEYQNASSKLATNTYDLKSSWIDQSIDRHVGKRTASSVSSESHQVVLVRAKGGAPICLKSSRIQLITDLQAALARFTVSDSDDPDLESFQSATVLASALGRILSVNSKLVRMFGYEKAEDLIGETVSVLMEDKVACKHATYMENYRLTGNTKMMGKGTVVKATEANGKSFAVMIYLGRFSTADGREERLIGSFVKRSATGHATPDKGSRNAHRSSSYHLTRSNRSDGGYAKLEVVDLLCTHIELYGCDTEGVFRLSGSAAEVDKLVRTLQQASSVYDIDLSAVNLHVVTGALKKYLSQPLIVGALYDRFIEAAKEQDSEKRLDRLLDCVVSMPTRTMVIFRRLWMLFGQIVERSAANKMNDQNLGICMSPLLTNPEPSVLLEHSQTFSNIFSTLITQYDRVYDLFPTTAGADSSYRIFAGPMPLDQNEWNLLLSNADRKSFPSDGMTIIEENTECHDMFYIQEGTVVVTQEEVVVARLSAGHIVGAGCFLGMGVSAATVKSGRNGCVTMRINSLYVDKLFDIEKQLCMKFCWQLAQDTNQLWLSVPMAGLDPAELESADDSAADDIVETPKEFPVHLSDGRVHVFDFHPAMSVALMVDLLRRTYPKECRKNPVLFEKIGDKTLEVLQPTALMGALQVRKNFANAPYKVIFPLGKDRQGNRRRASRKRSGNIQQGNKGTSDLSNSGGSDGGGAVNLLENEQDKSVLIKEFANCCKLKKKLGTLVLLHNCMIHSSTKLLGFESRFVLLYNDVKNVGISKGDNTLLLDTVENGTHTLHKLKFKETAVCGEAFDLLRSLCRGTNIAKKVARSASTDPKVDMSSIDSVLDRQVPDLMALFVEQFEGGDDAVRAGALLQITGGIGTPTVHGRLVGCKTSPLSVPAEKLDLMLHVWLADIISDTLERGGYLNPRRLPTATDWDHMLRGAAMRRFRPGQRIAQEGSCLQRVYVVVTGTCRIEQRASYEEQQSAAVVRADTLRFTSAYLGPGDVFGVPGFITGSSVEAVVAHDASIGAAMEDDIVVAVIEAKHLQGLFEKDPGLASRFYKFLMTVLHTRFLSSMRERSAFS